MGNDDDGTIRRKTKKALMHAMLTTQSEAMTDMTKYLVGAGVTKPEDFEAMMSKTDSMIMTVDVKLDATSSSFMLPLTDKAPDADSVEKIEKTIKVRAAHTVTTAMAKMEEEVVKYVYDTLQEGSEEADVVIQFAPQGDQKWLV